MSAVPFEEVVTSADQLMGVKAVFGAIHGRAMCFGSRGSADLKDKGYFQSARITAGYAADRPFMIAIGAGDECPPELLGRVLNVARVSKVFGETPIFYTDPEDRQRLARWPVATALLDVYEVGGQPHLVDDLGLPDRSILNNAYDLVVRPGDKVDALWEGLRGIDLNLLDLPPLPNFREPDQVTLVGSFLPKKVSQEEGRKVYREVQIYERKSTLAKEARRQNREANDGKLVCRGCDFSDELDGLFDVHHLVPLMLGSRETTLSDLAVLCPTCHRWAHRKGRSVIDPLSLGELRAARLPTIS